MILAPRLQFVLVLFQQVPLNTNLANFNFCFTCQRFKGLLFKNLVGQNEECHYFLPSMLMLINTCAASLTEFAAKPVTKTPFSPDCVLIP